MWPPQRVLRDRVSFLIAAVTAVLIGTGGWFLGPQWGVAGTLIGPVVAWCLLLGLLAWTRPDPEPALARTLLRQADLLAQEARHGEALAVTEPAVQIYRHLAVSDRNTYLPHLAAALTRQADELGHLDRISEAHAAAAEAEMIRTDMLPPVP